MNAYGFENSSEDQGYGRAQERDYYQGQGPYYVDPPRNGENSFEPSATNPSTHQQANRLDDTSQSYYANHPALDAERYDPHQNLPQGRYSASNLGYATYAQAEMTVPPRPVVPSQFVTPSQMGSTLPPGMAAQRSMGPQYGAMLPPSAMQSHTAMPPQAFPTGQGQVSAATSTPKAKAPRTRKGEPRLTCTCACGCKRTYYKRLVEDGICGKCRNNNACLAPVPAVAGGPVNQATGAAVINQQNPLQSAPNNTIVQGQHQVLHGLLHPSSNGANVATGYRLTGMQDNVLTGNNERAHVPANSLGIYGPGRQHTHVAPELPDHASMAKTIDATTQAAGTTTGPSGGAVHGESEARGSEAVAAVIDANKLVGKNVPSKDNPVGPAHAHGPYLAQKSVNKPSNEQKREEAKAGQMQRKEGAEVSGEMSAGGMIEDAAGDLAFGTRSKDILGAEGAESGNAVRETEGVKEAEDTEDANDADYWQGWEPWPPTTPNRGDTDVRHRSYVLDTEMKIGPGVGNMPTAPPAPHNMRYVSPTTGKRGRSEDDNNPPEQARKHRRESKDGLDADAALKDASTAHAEPSTGTDGEPAVVGARLAGRKPEG